MPLVTVLMPVHNGAKYLREAVDSVLNQTMADFELLIVDDASEDESPSIIASYSDPRLRYIRSDQRLKLAGALNHGLSVARGEFIARMDCDDICRSKRLEKQVAHFYQNGEMVICGTAIETFGSGAYGTKVYPCGSDNIRAYLLFDNPFAHPTIMLRKEIIKRARIQYDELSNSSEDYALWAEVVPRYNCDNLKEPLLRYRVHSDSVTRTCSVEMDRQAMRVQRQLFSRFGLEADEEELFVHRYGTTHRLYPQNDMMALYRLGRWYTKLQGQAMKTTHYDRKVFARHLSEFWYAACYQAMKTMKDVGIFTCYFSSRPPQMGFWGRYYDLLFILAWLKDRAKGSDSECVSDISRKYH